MTGTCETILVPVSGGLDSTWVLWHLLTTRPETPIAAFHVHYVTHMLRHVPEREAARAVVAWCARNVRPVKWYREATLDMHQLSTPAMDAPMVTALILAAALHDGDCRTIATGDTACAIKHLWPRAFNEIAAVMWKHLANPQFIDAVPPPVTFNPAVDTNTRKSDMRQQMPKELFDMTWSCHRPVWTPTGAKKCLTCFSCTMRGDA